MVRAGSNKIRYHPLAGRFVDLLAGNDETPDTPVARAEEAARVKQVVEELPSHYREILLLSYFHRMSYQQISETLAVPLGTVKGRMRIGLQKLRRALELQGNYREQSR